MGQLPGPRSASTLLPGGPPGRGHLLSAPVSAARAEEAAALVRSSTGLAAAAATCPWLGPGNTEQGPSRGRKSSCLGLGEARGPEAALPEAASSSGTVVRSQPRAAGSDDQALSKLVPFLAVVPIHGFAPRLRSRHSPVALETEGALVAQSRPRVWFRP